MTVTLKATRRTKKVLIEIEKAQQRHHTALKNALNDVGAEVVRETKKLIINGPKTGRVYRFGSGFHQASAPGEAPANRTGRLAESGDYRVKNWQEMTVGETAEYAGYLEDGTRKRIAPRPHLIRAVNNQARNTITAILNAVQEEVRM